MVILGSEKLLELARKYDAGVVIDEDIHLESVLKEKEW